MQRTNVLVWLLVAAIILTSCQKLIGEGPVVNETRATPNFSGVLFKIPGKLYYAIGTAYKVELQSHQNILDEIETIISGTDLVVHFRHSDTRLKSGEDVVVNVTAPALTKLEVHGTGDIQAQSSFDPASLRLLVSGSGNIYVTDVVTNSMDAEISGSGRIKVADGACGNQSLEISGSGEMDFGNLVAQHTNTDISGSGTMKLSADQTLDVKISGSASVRYRGNPVVTSSISGSGSVSRW